MFSSICKNCGRIAKQLIAQLAIIFYLTGCSPSGEGGEFILAGTTTTDVPEVTLMVDSTTVGVNDDVLLGWSAYNVSDCMASGDWSGSKGVAGQELIQALTEDSTFTITCSGNSESVSETVSVTVAGGTVPPTVLMSASPTSLLYGGSTTLNWISTNANSCSASDGWTGAVNTSGSRTIDSLTSNTRFSLSCTGAGGTTTEWVDISVGAPAPAIPPVVNLSASPMSIAYNGSHNLTWSTSNADSCIASGSWSGIKAVSGTSTRNNQKVDKTYTLTCTGAGGTSSDTVSVTVAAPPPTLSFSASPATVNQNGSTTLSWDSSGTTDCAASGDWSGNRAVSGSLLVSGLTTDSQFSLVCNGPGGSVNDTVNVAVVLNSTGTALLSWAPPTENEDNTTLTDLAGYRIYYGVSSGNYSAPIVIDNPGLSSYLLENLASATWYFSMTAVNSSGAESVKSLEVSKTIN